MDKEQLKQKRLQVLDDTVKYYGENPNERRCINLQNQKCYYSPVTAENPKSEGCAIGRLLTPEQKLNIDMSYPGGIIVSNLDSKYLPKEVLDLGLGFLGELQSFHDSSQYFDYPNNKLSEFGISQIEYIKEYIKKEETHLD